jgi:hypothetical protein
MGKKINGNSGLPGASFCGVDTAQAIYWNSHPTRDELQKAIEPISQALLSLLEDVHGNTDTKRPGLIEIIAKLDVTIAFIMDRLGVTPEEFQIYLNRKMAEFQALQAQAQAKDSPSGEPNNIIVAG